MIKKVKILIDILMAIIFIMLMCNQITGIFVHEILGISVIVLFIIHQMLNINYYKNILKGKYNKLRIAYLTIDILLFIMMLVMILSSTFISRYIFKFLNLFNDSLGRKLHILSAYSIYILIGLHIGLHYNSIVKLKNEYKIFLNIFMCLFAVIFGIQGFIKREFINKLILQNLYPIYFKQNFIIILIDYIGILIMFVMIGYGIYNLLKLRGRSEKNE